jgi:tRNA dimethylallyltransferase
VARLQCVCLTGVTAAGKTDLALALAEHVPLEIVSMDSAMVYRGLDIGTAKPTRAERAAVPHHLIDIVDPTEAYSAGRFARDAVAALRGIAGRGRLPLIVGGSLLYLKALRHGFAELPDADARVRTQLDEEAAAQGWPALHARLAVVDPAAAARIAPNDRQRIQRALEVHALTGRALSELQLTQPIAPDIDVLVVALVPPDRAALAARIERRFDAMVEAGFVEEVRALRARGNLSLGMPALRAVGYRQLWQYLDGMDSWEHARGRAIYATRQFAKRQLTWLRSEEDCEQWQAFAPDLPRRFTERVAQWRAAAGKRGS